MMATHKRVLQLLCSASVLSLAATLAVPALAQPQNVSIKGRVVSYEIPLDQSPSLGDIANAIPMPLPSVDYIPENALKGSDQVDLGAPGSEPGHKGTGKLAPMDLPPGNTADTLIDRLGDEVAPQEYGTALVPYTTARVDTLDNNVSKTYPYSAVGKLYFKDGTSDYFCSGALIKRGVVVTAAHCVAAFGKKRFYTGFRFVPAQYKLGAPYEVWSGERAVVMTTYFSGTDQCAPGARGVICKNDVAVIRLKSQSDAYPGTKTGWLGYGWNGWGFTSTKLTLVSQLGYPATHDKGEMMQRTDSQGVMSGSNMAGNTLWGSRQTGGSSGGPEVLNLGIQGELTTPVGMASDPNIVIGVTSWGYGDSNTIKLMGASPFLSTNILALINTVCAGDHPACK